MTATLAPTLQAFFTDRLVRQRGASPHTIAAYRDTMRLLLTFAQQRLAKPPSTLDLADLDAPLIGAFLDHLQHERGNSVRTRNARLAAIHSLFKFAALRHPEQAALIQRVLAIPPKRFDKALITYLNPADIEALLAAPDRLTHAGRRDHALLLLAVRTGLRVSELVNLNRADLHLGTGAHVDCLGKGRKHRSTPLDKQTVAVLKAWLDERGGEPDDPLLPGPHRCPAQPRRGRDGSSASTPPPPASRPSRPTCCATPRPCNCSTPASTSPSSRSGSATNKPKPRRSTCTPT